MFRLGLRIKNVIIPAKTKNNKCERENTSNTVPAKNVNIGFMPLSVNKLHSDSMTSVNEK